MYQIWGLDGGQYQVYLNESCVEGALGTDSDLLGVLLGLGTTQV